MNSRFGGDGDGTGGAAATAEIGERKRMAGARERK